MCLLLFCRGIFLKMKMVAWCIGVLVQVLLVAECAVTRHGIHKKDDEYMAPPVQLNNIDDYVVVENGIVKVTFSIPEGMVTGIEYSGIENVLEDDNPHSNRGYWDFVWSDPQNPGDIYDKLEGREFRIIMDNEDQVELSFTRTWDPSSDENLVPLNIDKRFIILREMPGFYSYSIFERLEGWPDTDIYQGRIAFKLKQDLFRYMAVSDERQRIMPTAQDRESGRPLEYPEAVLLTNASNPFLEGEVDDKYQYSIENKDNRVHGWICPDPAVGFWMITPSTEFRTGGPVKQDLTSHAGPVTLSMFFSTHYAGEPLTVKFRDGEAWKKVLGPVFIYLNSVPDGVYPLQLWSDAKQQMLIETESWPYDFPVSEDFAQATERGSITGRLLVRDRYINEDLMTANSAYVGLAAPGDAGSWQRENKGYQFWVQTDVEGYFIIKNVMEGNYSLYGWVPGFIGDYKYDYYINVRAGRTIRLGDLIYDPPRNGPTMWEIGVPDRTAIEFYVPEANPSLMNKLYVINYSEKFRQYGLWNRYADLYPDEDLVYTVGESNYEIDWFFAHVNRNIENGTYVSTTWQILFDSIDVDETRNYTLQVALASATNADLQIRINDPDALDAHFTTGLIGKDNAIARHGIHGLYWLYSIDISGSLLIEGTNTIYLKQARGLNRFNGIMYDYIRLEQPSTIE